MSKLTSIRDIVASKKDYQSVPKDGRNRKTKDSEDKHREHRVFKETKKKIFFQEYSNIGKQILPILAALLLFAIAISIMLNAIAFFTTPLGGCIAIAATLIIFLIMHRKGIF